MVPCLSVAYVNCDAAHSRFVHRPLPLLGLEVIVVIHADTQMFQEHLLLLLVSLTNSNGYHTYTNDHKYQWMSHTHEWSAAIKPIFESVLWYVKQNYFDKPRQGQTWSPNKDISVCYMFVDSRRWNCYRCCSISCVDEVTLFSKME